jgi:hypothetical protein
MEMISRVEHQSQEGLNTRPEFENHMNMPMDHEVSHNNRLKMQIEILTGNLINQNL